VWEYFSGKAEQRGVQLSELLTEVLKRDIEINEALKQVIRRSRRRPWRQPGSPCRVGRLGRAGGWRPLKFIPLHLISF
jgi:hypothetical protein